MLSAKLRHRITIQSQSTSQDSFGQQVITWTNVLTNVPAGVEPLFAYERIEGQAFATYQVKLRYDSTLANPVAVAGMRLLFGARILEIVGSINLDERNREITLSCTEGLTEG